LIKAIINARIYDFHQFIDKGFIIFDKQILKVGHMKDFVDENYQIIDAEDHLVMPGLINSHTHIYSTFARGMSVPFHPQNFQEILDQLWWKLDRNINNQTTYYSGIVSGVDHIKNGVTTMIDHHASGIDIKGSLEMLKRAVCDEVGLRGIFAFETSDRFDVDQTILENIEFAKNNKTSFTRGLFGLHASMSLSEDTLKKVKKNLGDLPVHIHVAESTMDERDAQLKYKEKIMKRLERHGLLNPDSIIAHGIYIDDEEMQIIKDHDCKIAVNFNSNMNNSVGLPPLKAFKKHGIGVIVGNDGISSSITTEYLSLYYATHLLDGNPNDFGLEDLRSMILEAYDYASRLLEVKLGKIESGYEADLLIVPYLPPTPIHQDNALGHLFFGLFNSFKPRCVFVGGKKIVDYYQVNEYLQNIYYQATHEAEKLWQRIQ